LLAVNVQTWGSAGGCTSASSLHWPMVGHSLVPDSRSELVNPVRSGTFLVFKFFSGGFKHQLKPLPVKLKPKKFKTDRLFVRPIQPGRGTLKLGKITLSRKGGNKKVVLTAMPRATLGASGRQSQHQGLERQSCSAPQGPAPVTRNGFFFRSPR